MKAIQKKKKQKSLNLPDLISKDMAKIAASLDIEPYLLTKSEYFANGPKFREWELRKVGGFIGIRNTFFEGTEKRSEVDVADLKELRLEYRKLRRDSGDLDLLIKKIKDAITEMPRITLKPYRKSLKKPTKLDPRTLNLLLSDLHFGSDLSVEEHGTAYGPVEEARALAGVVKNVCSYKMQYREQTDLVVNILGDVIENQLHGAATSADLLHMQACRAMYLLSQAIGRFSESFPSVRVNFAVGNHGRDTSIHKQRATEQKFNAIETTIYYGIRLACQSLKNVTFNQPKLPYITYDAQGHKVYATHGDTHLNPGNPGGKIDTKSLENQTNKINASLSDKEEFAVFAVGHVHQAMVTVLSNGAALITNGPMVPPNGFANSINVVECQQIQTMWESTKKFAVGDFRFINVTDTENNQELDRLIKPFKGINNTLA